VDNKTPSIISTAPCKKRGLALPTANHIEQVDNKTLDGISTASRKKIGLALSIASYIG
jgi:hypothetical protein